MIQSLRACRVLMTSLPTATRGWQVSAITYGTQRSPQRCLHHAAAVASAARPNAQPDADHAPPLGRFLRRVLLGAAGAATLAVSLTLAPPALARAAEPAPPPPAASISMPWAARDRASPPAAAAAVPATMESKEPAPSPEALAPDELATVRLFQENTPAVVNIANIVAARIPFSMDTFQIPQGQGSGFVWDTEGHIVTNYHVVRGAAEVRVALIDQSVWRARIVGGDPTKDVAVLQLEAPAEVIAELKPVKLGASSGLFVGQRVLAIGNPFGLDHTLTQGIISGLNRELANGSGPSLRNVIQTDAAINPGNSGGPLLDSRGCLIGINTAIADPSGKGSSSGIGFAVPIDTVKGLVDQILRYGRVVRPVLGVTIAPPQALRQLGLEGVLVLDVPRGSPADKAGMQGLSKDSFGRVVIGDVIVGFNGRHIRSEGDLFDQLDSVKVGDTAKVDVLRHGRERSTLTVVLAERAPESAE